MKEMTQLKNHVAVTTARAADLLQVITLSKDGEEPWAWVNTQEWLRDLRNASAELSTRRQNSEFWKKISSGSEDLKLAAENTHPKIFITQMQTAKLELTAATEKVEKEVEALTEHRSVREKKLGITIERKSKPGKQVTPKGAKRLGTKSPA